MLVYIFDLDGTLFDCSHRLHHIQGDKKDWESFYADVGQDRPIWHMIGLAKRIIAGGAVIVYATGRSDVCRGDTQNCLAEVGLPQGPLYMRHDGDFRPDHVVKEEMLQAMYGAGMSPVLAFDDHNPVVAMWRRNHVPCAQVADGDY